MKALEVVTTAKALIADPKHWTKGYLAVDKLGRLTSLRSPQACKWCMSGAIHRAAYNLGGIDEFGVATPEAISVLRDICLTFRALYPEPTDGKRMRYFAQFNDHYKTTHADVMEIFDKAIAHYDGSEPKTMKAL
jgi:hypothetical protein